MCLRRLQATPCNTGRPVSTATDRAESVRVQVVVAPHVYPPSISTATDRYSGAPLWLRLSQSFGYLNKAGYCADSGQCTQFAVVIGETGSAFQDHRDAQCMADFSSYLNNAGAPAACLCCLSLDAEAWQLPACMVAMAAEKPLAPCMMRLRPSRPPDSHLGPECVSLATAFPASMYAGAANDGLHNAIPNVFWWAWNANSGGWRYMPTPTHCTMLHMV